MYECLRSVFSVFSIYVEMFMQRYAVPVIQLGVNTNVYMMRKKDFPKEKRQKKHKMACNISKKKKNK